MNNAVWRVSCFLALLLLLGLAEWLWPKQRVAMRRGSRWPVNLGLGLTGLLCLRTLMPWLEVDAASWSARNGIGLLQVIPLPDWLACVVSLVALDLLIYGQHRLMHRVGWLWRIHRVHHSDVALDVSSGVRFHPLEILLSMLLKIAAVIALGIAPIAVMAFEILLNGFAMFTHANLAIPVRADAWLRRIMVTPDMHRIHHSRARDERDSNFGFNLACWDRWFGSYREAPRHPQTTLELGLGMFRGRHNQRLEQLLLQPWRSAGSPR